MLTQNLFRLGLSAPVTLARRITSCMIWPGGWQNRVQLTTDGHKAYLTAVEDAFGAEIDYAMLQKIYGIAPHEGEVRYSPAQCMGARKAVISGNPDFRHVSTSHTERQNLSMRMGNLVHFNQAAIQIAELFVHDALAAFANADAKPHDGITVNACYALNGANAVPFAEQADCLRLLFRL